MAELTLQPQSAFTFFLFFSPSPSWVLLILLWLHKSPPAVEGVTQLELRQGNGSGVSAPRVTGQILNDDTRQCARRKKKVNRQAEKKVGRFPERFSRQTQLCWSRLLYQPRGPPVVSQLKQALSPAAPSASCVSQQL